MGVRASLSEIPPELFSELVAGGEPTLLDEVQHSIDKAWHDFHVVFRAMGHPLRMAISGDSLHPLSPHSLDEFCQGNHEWYFGLVSPHLVQEVAAVLVIATATDYKRWETEAVGPDYNCGETFFSDLRSAYVEAASRGNALIIMVC